MIQFQEQVLISAPPEKVFALYANVANWPSWNPAVKKTSIEGSFRSGVGGTLTPSKGPKAKILFSVVVQNKSFTSESKLPLCVLRFEHELVREGDQTKAVHRITFQGLLSGLFGRIIGNQIRAGLPNTLMGLKRASEAS